MTEPLETHNVRLDWPDELPILVPINQFASQISAGPPDGLPEEIILTLGHATPPLIVGTPEEQAERIRAIESVPVQVFGRYLITRARLHELVQVLGTAAAQWDAAHGLTQPEGDPQ